MTRSGRPRRRRLRNATGPRSSSTTSSGGRERTARRSRAGRPRRRASRRRRICATSTRTRSRRETRRRRAGATACSGSRCRVRMAERTRLLTAFTPRRRNAAKIVERPSSSQLGRAGLADRARLELHSSRPGAGGRDAVVAAFSLSPPTRSPRPRPVEVAFPALRVALRFDAARNLLELREGAEATGPVSLHIESHRKSVRGPRGDKPTGAGTCFKTHKPTGPRISTRCSGNARSVRRNLDGSMKSEYHTGLDGREAARGGLGVARVAARARGESALGGRRRAAADGPRGPRRRRRPRRHPRRRGRKRRVARRGGPVGPRFSAARVAV